MESYTGTNSSGEKKSAARQKKHAHDFSVFDHAYCKERHGQRKRHAMCEYGQTMKFDVCHFYIKFICVCGSFSVHFLLKPFRFGNLLLLPCGTITSTQPVSTQLSRTHHPKPPPLSLLSHSPSSLLFLSCEHTLPQQNHSPYLSRCLVDFGSIPCLPLWTRTQSIIFHNVNGIGGWF